jgi:hypothetical protein
MAHTDGTKIFTVYLELKFVGAFCIVIYKIWKHHYETYLHGS